MKALRYFSNRFRMISYCGNSYPVSTAPVAPVAPVAPREFPKIVSIEDQNKLSAYLVNKNILINCLDEYLGVPIQVLRTCKDRGIETPVWFDHKYFGKSIILRNIELGQITEEYIEKHYSSHSSHNSYGSHSSHSSYNSHSSHSSYDYSESRRKTKK